MAEDTEDAESALAHLKVPLTECGLLTKIT